MDPNPESGGYTFKAYLNPLISWIWIGGFVVILGTHIAVLPEFKRQRSLVTDPAAREAQSVVS